MKAFKPLFALKITLFVVLAGIIAAVIWYKTSDEPDNASIRQASIKDVSTMVRLCSMDIYEEVPIKAHIGKKHLFARQRLHGTVSFDIEKLTIDTVGDTVCIVLPPEIIEVYESTEPDAYQVIDTWNTSFLGSDKFTTAEENSIKAKAKQQWIKRQYAKGIVSQARREACYNLHDMFSNLYGKPVKVIDPTPQGSAHP